MIKEKEAKELLAVVQNIDNDLKRLGIYKKPDPVEKCLYDELITNSRLRKKTEKLFKDGHHARAVEEAFKLLDNVVKSKAEVVELDLTGANLMNRAFSSNNPILKLNEGVSSSEKNEQMGYMQIFAGCMTGIRNPRAHDSDWEDTEQRALQLLVLADHLIGRAYMAEKV